MNVFRLRRRLYVIIPLICGLFVLYFLRFGSVRAANRAASIPASATKPLVKFKSPQTVNLKYLGSREAVEALTSGSADPTALASADFNADGAPDVIAGYATTNGGVVTLLLGNPDAYAPKDTSLYEKAMRGNVPATFLPTAAAYTVPESPELIVTGDFNLDGRQDVLVAARGGNLYLLPGDGHGKLRSPQRVPLDGPVRAMAAAGDGHVAVTLDGENGPEFRILSPASSGLSAGASNSLPARGESVAWGNLGGGADLAVGAGSHVQIVYNALQPNSRTETVDLPFQVDGLTLGDFIWDRDGRTEIAALAGDGTIHILQHGTLDTRPIKREEISGRRAALRAKAAQRPDPLTLGAWTEAKKLTYAGSAPTGPVSASAFSSPRLAASPTQDLMLLDGARNLLNILDTSGRTQSPSAEVSFSSAPVAALTLPQKINAGRDTIVLVQGGIEPLIQPAGGDPTFNVTTTADEDDAGACSLGSSVTSGAGPDGLLSLREAVCEANNSGAVTSVINVPAGTYSLSLNSYGGGSSSYSSPELQVGMTAGANISIVGASEGETIIQQTDGVSRIIEADEELQGSMPLAISNLTLQNGTCTDSGLDCLDNGGGAILAGYSGDTLTLTNVAFNNNSATSASGTLGGAVTYTGPSLTITDSTFSNNTASGTGGAQGGGVQVEDEVNGVAVSGSVTITNSIFNGNSASSGNDGNANGGGLYFGGAAGFSASVTGSTFTGNTASSTGATGAASGGGIIALGGAFTLSNSRIVGNTLTSSSNTGSGYYGIFLTSTVTDNWWGCNAGPGASGCDAVVFDTSDGSSGTFTPWLVLGTNASATAIGTGDTSTLTAITTQDSNGGTGFSVPDGTDITFGGTLGTANPTAAATSGGQATSTFTAGSTPGAGTGTATLDNQTVDVTIDVAGPPNLAVSKTHTGTFTQGSTAEWDIQVSNSASSTLDPTTGATVTVQDTLPAGYTLSSVSASGWNCGGSTTVTCTSAATVAGNGGIFPLIQLFVNVPAASPTSVTNTAIVYGGGDPNHTNSGNGATGSDSPSVVQIPASLVITGGNNQSANVGTPFASNLSVEVEDAGGVAIANYPSVTFTAPASGPSGIFSDSSNTIVAPANGGGTASVSFTANGTVGGPYLIQVSAGAASTSFNLTNGYIPVPTSVVVSAPSSAYVGGPFNFTVTVYDQLSNIDTSYTGTLSFTSSDTSPSIVLPSPSTLTSGTGIFSATLVTPATQTITATDPTNIISGTSNGILVSIPTLVVNEIGDDGGTASNCSVQTTPGTTTNADTCYLRDALLQASALGSANISFDSTVFLSTNSAAANTINLTTGTLNIPSNTSITGPTSGSGYTLANLVTVAGGGSTNQFSVFTVNSGVTAASIDGLTIIGGYASDGGGINNSGALTLSNCFLNNNTGLNEGGAIFSNNGTLTITNSLIWNNETPSGSIGGGGIYSSSGTLTLTNSTITDDQAYGSNGGAISVASGTATVTNSTISGNQANGGSGGGIYNTGGTVTLANSIVSGDTASSDADIFGNYTDSGGNILGNVNGTVINSAPLNLAALGNYGGPTQTMLPLPASSAICAGTSTNAAGLTTDQRGLPLPDPNCPSGSVDAGAVQTNYALSFSTQPGSTQYESDYILPSPAVALTENGVAATAPTSTVTISDTTLPTYLGGTLSQALAAGSATFPKLEVSALEASDTLTATLSLNPSLSTPLNLVSLPSNAFSVNAPTTTALTSPTPGSMLTGPSATFIWTAGSGATSYTLWLGSTGVGSNNIWGSGATTATSVTFGGLPTNGEKVYARLYATVNGVSKHYDYTFTAATAAILTSPTVGSTLLGTGATFKWTAPTGATSYSLWLGSTGVGSNNIWGSGTTTATSVTFTALPINGETVFARLFTNFNGFSVHADFTYTAVAAAVLLSPTPNSTLASPSATFQWTAPTGATSYNLWLGSTGVGTNNIWGSGSTTATSVTFGGLPTNGETIYARLFSTVNGAQLHTDYTFKAGSVAVLTSPSPNSTLAGPTTTFQWTAPTGATAYTLWLGSTGVGSNNLADLGSTTATSATLGGLPINGETIYVRLYTTLSGFKLHADFTYTAASAAVLTSPSPTSTLAGPSTTFQWTAPTGATAYTLWLGSSGVGSNNIWSSGSTTSTSATFNALPTNGETIYARLFTTLGGVSVHTDTTYTAASAAALTSPTPNSTFTSTSETFMWTAVSNASQYSIWVGTSVGSNNLGYTQGGTTSTFFTLNNLPTNGETIHVRLYTNYPGGGLAHNDYTFTAYTAVTGTPVTHTIQISNDADDGYYNNDDGSGWHSDPQAGGADWVGSWSGTTEAWVTGYRFESTGINSGDPIQSAYLQLWSSDGFATSSACGGAPCASSNSTFRVYGVAQDDGPAFSNATGNTPLDVPYTTAYTDYTTTGPGDDHGSCQGQNNGQNTCTHTIDVTAIVNEITSRPGWTNTSSMRFVMLSTDPTAPSVYAGFEDSSANAAKAATLAVNPQVPTIVSSGAFGTGAQITYPTTYETGPFVYQGASTLLLFLGDYYNFYGQVVDQPTVTDSCGNTWNILAGPTDWMGMIYDMRSTVYFVQSPASCPGGDTITVTADNQEPIFLHFLAIAGSDTTQAPVVSAITSPTPGTYTTSATSNSVTLANGGLLVSWIFGDSDSPTTFTPPTGFVTDPNSTPTYLTAVSEGVSSAGSYQSQFAISPSDGWQVVTIGFSAPTP